MIYICVCLKIFQLDFKYQFITFQIYIGISIDISIYLHISRFHSIPPHL